MDFTRETTTTLTAELKHDFSIVIHNDNGLPRWTVSLVDYDNATGAVGVFSSEKEAIDNLEGFLNLAMPAYEQKHAKCGRMPVISLDEGKLAIVIKSDDPEDDMDLESSVPVPR